MTTLHRHAAGPAVARALDAALAAVDPTRAVEAVLDGHGPELTIAGHALGPGRRVVVSVGKAAAAMARPVVARLGDRLEGLVVGKTPADVAGLPTIVAGHPLPDDASVHAGRRIAALADGLQAGDTLIALLSGGASALALDLPAGIELQDLRRTIAALLVAGADIEAINAVRKHLDGCKGGQLAARAAPGRVIALVLSDVVDDRLDVIASAPTVGDPTSFADALSVLERHAIDVPPRVLARLRAGAAGTIADTPFPGDPRLDLASTTIVAGNATATQAAASSLREAGYAIDEPIATLVGEARDAGRALAQRLVGLPPGRPRAIVAGGETVVRVHGSGRGGRNQELALAAAEVLAGHGAHLVATLATDGEDGPTDAAGAVVDGHTIARARARGLHARDHLDRNDAYAYFDALGDLLRTGPTGTNVCDLALAVYDPGVPS